MNGRGKTEQSRRTRDGNQGKVSWWPTLTIKTPKKMVGSRRGNRGKNQSFAIRGGGGGGGLFQKKRVETNPNLKGIIKVPLISYKRGDP